MSFVDDAERFLELYRAEPCELYAHALREAARSIYMDAHQHTFVPDADYSKCSCGAMRKP